MGARGPKPKPTALKILDGNPGKRAPSAAEPMPSPEPPRCPAWLADEAKKKWKALAPELGRLRLLTSVDGDALACYCQAWAQYREATEALAKEGMVTKSPSGYLAPHPAHAQQQQALAAMHRLSQSFGLDPASRARLTAPPAAEGEDPFEEFLAGVGKGGAG